MPIDEILSHPYDLSCLGDVKSQINQPKEHVTISNYEVNTKLDKNLRFYLFSKCKSAYDGFDSI